MVFAHSGVAMAASPADSNAPLLAFLVASWSPDLTGVAHWLPFGAAVAVLVYVVARRRWSSRAALALALLVGSHLLLDLVVGLQIWPGGRFYGLHLSTRSSVELALEVAVVVAGFTVYALGRRSFTPLLGATFVVTLAFIVVVWAFPEGATADDVSPAKLAVEAAGLLATSALLVVNDRRSVRPRTVGAT